MTGSAACGHGAAAAAEHILRRKRTPERQRVATRQRIPERQCVA